MSDKSAMARAVALAQKGLGHVSPNPAVGCVLLSKHGTLLSEAYHKAAGLPHAEAAALDQLPTGADLTGATMVVTLEPCAHVGRTPSCAHKIAKLPIKRVLYGAKDPNPLVQGKGLEVLKNAGIKVVQLQAPGLKKLNEVFNYNMLQQKAFIALKVASSWDGFLGTKHATARETLSAPLALKHAHKLRRIYDAVLVGRKTLWQDRPQLNIRFGLSVPKKTKKILILDPDLKTFKKLPTLDLPIFKHHKAKDIFWICKQNTTPPPSCAYGNIIPCRSYSQGAGGVLDLGFLQHALYQKGICSVLVEGGAHTLSAFLQQGIGQKLLCFLSPTLIGGGRGLSWTAGFSAAFESRLKLQDANCAPLGAGQYLLEANIN